MTATDLATQHCQPMKGKQHALDAEKVTALLQQLPGWQLSDDKLAIIKDFKFDNFRHTLGFINALALWPIMKITTPISRQATVIVSCCGQPTMSAACR